MIYGVTGHRDAGQKPGELEDFARLIVARMIDTGCTEIANGMAWGWDMAVAAACVDLKLPFIALLPFPGQQQRWAEKDVTLFPKLLAEARTVWYAGKLRLNENYLKRDRLIVQSASQLWALDSGRPSGTHTTVLFAEEIGCTVVPLWDRWRSYQQERNPQYEIAW